MRLHIHVDDALVAEVDRIAGRRKRSEFVREALRTAVDHHRRWSLIEKAAGVIEDGGHAWDADPAAWVRRQRRRDPRRRG